MRHEERQVIRCWQSEDANKRAAVLFIHSDCPNLDEVPIFYGDTDGVAAGQVLAWMIDSGLSCSNIQIAVH